MIIGTIECSCRIPAAASLKDKRRVVKSVLTRIRNRYNLSVAEVAHQDDIQTVGIGMAGVANAQRRVEKVLDDALNLLDREHELEVISVDRWFG